MTEMSSVPRPKPPIPPKPKYFLKHLADEGHQNVVRSPSNLCHPDVAGTPDGDTNESSKQDETQVVPVTLPMASNGNSEPKHQDASAATVKSTKSVPEKGNTITENWSLKESLESGDEACCTRISYLFQRKAKEFSSQLTRASKPRAQTSFNCETAGSLRKQPLSFGDEISANSIRFVDEDISEISSDYQDLDLSRVANEATAASVHHVTRTKVMPNVCSEGEVMEKVQPLSEDITLHGPVTENAQNAAKKTDARQPRPQRPSAPNRRENCASLINAPKDPKQSVPKKKPLRPPPPALPQPLVRKEEVLENMGRKVAVQEDGHHPKDVCSISHMQECHNSAHELKEGSCAHTDADHGASTECLSSVDRGSGNVQTKKKRTPPPRPPPPKLKPTISKSVSSIDDCCQTDDLIDYRAKNVIEDLDKLLLMQGKPHESVSPIEDSLNRLVKETAHKFLPPGEVASTAAVDEHPKPPPRLKRRARSKTVEAVSARVSLPRRSHSLSEADVIQKKAYREGLKAKDVAATLTETFVMVVESPITQDELRSLCANVAPKDSEANKEFKEPPYPSQIRFRPLPAPPPPPRGRTRTCQRSGNNEQPVPSKETAKHVDEHKKAVTEVDKSHEVITAEQRTESQTPCPSETTEMRHSTDDAIQPEGNPLSKMGSNSGISPSEVPREKRVSGSTFYDCLDVPPEAQQTVESPVEGMSEKSRTNWYDDSDTSGDVADVDSPVHPSDSDRPLSSSPSSVHRPRAKGAKEKKRPSSKFYCNVEERESSTDREVDRVCSAPRRKVENEDKGEDTDELLERAQGLQEEMHQVLVERQKRLLQNLESELSGQQMAVDESKEEKEGVSSEVARGEEDDASTGPPEDYPSALVPSSEVIWQGSSDEESDADDASRLSTGEASVLRNKRKLFYIAKEMATSENVFVDVLRLLNVDFRSAIHKASLLKGYPVIPEEVLEQVLKHLPQLQALNERLLTDLCDRVEHWEDRAHIADIFVKIGPFLKLYSSYIMDFEPMTVVLEEARRKYPDFAQVARVFEKSPRCKQLTIEQYMLKPIQRIPQYRLLLQDYVNHLAVDAEDYQDACHALEIVSQVANHANESMKLGDNFSKLISLQNRIQGHFEVIKPGRVIIREGELMKASRKIMQPRWFVLFSDSLLYLTPVQQGYYTVNYELPLSGMKVMVPQQPDYKNEFSIITTRRSFILSASSSEEREQWITALNKAIEDTVSRKCSFLLLQKDGGEDSGNSELGKEAPVWIPDRRVTMCQLCTREFTFTHRRHHCRACGKVICSACSANRMALHYVGPKPVRVCDHCYYSLRLSTSCARTQASCEIRDHSSCTNVKKRFTKGILQEVAANDQGSLLSGYLHQWWKGTWKRRWFVIKDHVLYVYRASEDICASRTVALLSYQVQPVHKGFEEIPREHLFELAHSGIDSLIFYADSTPLAEQWKKAMEQATTLS